ncbi:MAG: histidinol-phosphate transaminase [Clostridia bacterium]|nr:histidinol-phosphate transaminase [Clostridia bacterium]
MSRFFSDKYRALTPYTPGEQPQDKRYIKLNTNESPFPPSEKAVALAAEAAARLQLYPDPQSAELTAKVAAMCGVSPDEVLLTNGSDDILNFAFMAFCDDAHPAAFPDITYGFYSVFAACNRVPYTEIPLGDDLTVNVDDYLGIGKTIFLANPNAPTGIVLPRDTIERIVQSNPDSVVVVDEAYVDFGGESCVPLIHKYDNLLVTQTFSKSRSMAGARLGFGVGCAALIQDLNTLKYATNPYNINRMTAAAGLGVLADEEYTRQNCQAVMDNRAYTMRELRRLGFAMTDSAANFVFAKHEAVDGAVLYRELKDRGILVRHFDAPRLAAYNRITIGSREEMEQFVRTVETILEEYTR